MQRQPNVVNVGPTNINVIQIFCVCWDMALIMVVTMSKSCKLDRFLNSWCWHLGVEVL